MSKVTLSIDPKQKEKLKETAGILDVSVSALLREWVEEILDNIEQVKAAHVSNTTSPK